MNQKLMTLSDIEKDREEWRCHAWSGALWERRYCGYWLQLTTPIPRSQVFHYALFTLRPELAPGAGDVWAWTDALVDRVYDVGVRLWGECWRAHADAPAVDVAVQIAVFGEVRYG